MSKIPGFVKSTGGNCGVYAVVMALNSVDVRLESTMIEKIAHSEGISYFGELYNKKQITGLLAAIKSVGYEFNYESVHFDTQEEFEKTVREATEAGKYILMAYYAFQGFVRAPAKVNMDRGHWMVIYNIDKKGNIYAIQSNSKANMLGALNNVTSKALFESNSRLADVKVNWGKYQKCEVNIFKKLLEQNPRCGESICKLNDKMDVHDCVYYSNLNNFGVVISK